MNELIDQELEAMLERAAEAGAKKALNDVGLHDDDAIHDVIEIRNLLDSWRRARRTATNTIVSVLTTAFLMAILGGTAWRSYFGGE